jgi:hypothetical protein
MLYTLDYLLHLNMCQEECELNYVSIYNEISSQDNDNICGLL